MLINLRLFLCKNKPKDGISMHLFFYLLSAEENLPILDLPVVCWIQFQVQLQALARTVHTVLITLSPCLYVWFLLVFQGSIHGCVP